MRLAPLAALLATWFAPGSSVARAESAFEAEIEPATTAPGHPAVALGLAIGVPLAVVAAGFATERLSEPVGSTLVSIGLIVGPSAGWLYARRPYEALGTAGVRTVAGLAFLLSASGSLLEAPDDDAAKVASIALIGATIYDLIGPPVALRGDRKRAMAMVVPLPAPAGGGLAVVGQF